MTLPWSVVGPMARPRARGPGPGLGINYEFVLRAGPGHSFHGPGPGLIIQFAGRARDSTSAAGPGRARAVTLPVLRARAGPGPQIIFAGRAWAQISGPCRTLVDVVVDILEHFLYRCNYDSVIGTYCRFRSFVI